MYMYRERERDSQREITKEWRCHAVRSTGHLERRKTGSSAEVLSEDGTLATYVSAIFLEYSQDVSREKRKQHKPWDIATLRRFPLAADAPGRE